MSIVLAALSSLVFCCWTRPIGAVRRSAWRHHARRFALACGLALAASAAGATIVFTASSSGRNEALPTDGSPGAVIIAKPAGITPGQAMIASIVARPSAMTVTAPAGWVQMTLSNQSNGGTATAPGGMTLVTYYKIVTVAEPASYTWTFANPANAGGTAVGGILAFSGIDTSTGNPIDNAGTAWSEKLTPSSFTHGTNPVTTSTDNALVISSISFLSASTFGTPTGISGLVDRLNLSAPAAANALGTTLQMATAPIRTAGNTGASSATAGSAGTSVDYGIGHLMALKPSAIDLALAISRGVPLAAGSSSSYVLTVSNLGLNTEPGPLTIVDTLPTGLSYSAASGSGWSCSASGQTVTCTRVGSLAADAVAPPLTINVSVSASASGTLTNSATVSGTGGDAAVVNDTASDASTVQVTPYAYWKLEEASWGSILDASGNGRNAVKLGSASPTGAAVPSPPGAALTGAIGTCGAGLVPAGTSAIGIDTAIDPNTLGNAGSLAFWYAGNAAWNSGTARMLFDASKNIAGGDRHFYLVKEANGALTFSLKDSAGTTSTAATGALAYPASAWHHIAVSWDVPASSLKIYIDGTLVASSTTALNGVLGDMNTLYIGARRSTGITGTTAGYTNNTADGHVDEVRLYAFALVGSAVASLASDRHACSTLVHHYELSLPSTGVACLASTVTVTACADASSPCTNPATTVAGYTAALSTGAGTLGTNTLSFDASGRASTTLQHPTASNGATATVTLSSEQISAPNLRQCCPNGSACSNANSCSISFSTAGFIIAASANGVAATLPTQTAGLPSATYYLRAVKTSTTTQACEPALTGNRAVDWALRCNNPSTCSSGNRLTLTGTSAATIASNPHSGVTSSTPLTMAFDANGNAPFSINYADVGQITLQASKAAEGTLLTALAGVSNAFVVKPAGFALSAIVQTAAPQLANPAAASAAGNRFVKAGESFGLTVTAQTSGGATTPNFGRETTPEGVLLAPALVLPAGGAAGTLANATLVGGSFVNGVASADTLSYSEVGIINLTASVASGSYLGSGNVTGPTSGNVGRFVPDHFALTPGTPVGACSGSFSYFGQDGFTTPFTLTAQNAANATTLNYSDGFAKLEPTSWSSYGFSATGLAAGSLLASGASAPTGVWIAGVAAVSAVHQVSRPSALAAETGVTVRATPTDSDGVTMATTAVGAATPLRWGRLRLSNAFGKAGAALQLPVVAEHWSGNAWVLNSADSCTTVPAASVALSNPRSSAGGSTTASTSASAITLTAGSGLLTLAAPSPAGSGLSLDIAINLGSTIADQSCLASHPATTGAAKPWLRALNGACAASADRDPAARASFGIFSPETRKTVHVREIF